MKYEKIKDSLIGSEKQFLFRAKRLYGYSDNSNIVDEFRKKNEKSYILIILLMILAVAVVITDLKDTTGIVKDSEGNAIAIDRKKDGQGENLTFKVTCFENGNRITKKVVLTVLPENYRFENEVNEKYPAENNTLENKIIQLSRKLSSDKSGMQLVLPQLLEEGSRLTWHYQKEKKGPFVVLLTILVFIFIYKERWREIEKLEEEARISVENSLPEFLSRIVLLMEAGCVFSTAFERVIYSKHNQKNGKMIISLISFICC